MDNGPFDNENLLYGSSCCYAILLVKPKVPDSTTNLKDNYAENCECGNVLLFCSNMAMIFMMWQVLWFENVVRKTEDPETVQNPHISSFDSYYFSKSAECTPLSYFLLSTNICPKTPI